MKEKEGTNACSAVELIKIPVHSAVKFCQLDYWYFTIMKMDLGFGWVSETISCTNLCAVPEITNTSPQMGMEFFGGGGSVY